MKASTKMISALALATLCTGAFAQQAASTGLYLYGALGSSRIENNQGQLDSILTGAGATGLSSSLDKTDTGYKLQAGYMFNRTFGVEGGWVDLGKFRYSAAYAGGSLNSDISVSGFNVAAIAAWPVMDRLSVFGKAGALYAETKASANGAGPGGAATLAAKDKTWVGDLGVGVSYDLSQNLAVRAEYERFFDVGNASTTGKSDVDLVSVGLKYSFR